MVGGVIFAQDVPDNVCFDTHPLHASHFPGPCTTDYDWKVGWCRNKIHYLNETIKFTYRPGMFTGYDPISSSYHYYVDDQYLDNGCQEMFKGNRTDEWLEERGYHRSAWDWNRDIIFLTYEGSSSFWWGHRRAINIVARGE